MLLDRVLSGFCGRQAGLGRPAAGAGRQASGGRGAEEPPLAGANMSDRT